MNKSIDSNLSLQAGLVAICAIAAAAIGAASSFEPILLFAIWLALGMLLLSVLHPELMSYLIIASSVISVQYLFDLQFYGMDLQSLYKLAVLSLALPAIARYGMRRAMVWPIAALFALLIITYTLADRHPLLTMMAPVQAFFGLAAPFVLLLVRWSKETAANQVRLITCLPMLCVAVGAILQTIGVHPLYVTEFTGAFRLQGASIPAHLAFLAFIGFLVTFVEIKRNAGRQRFFYVMMAINFLILLLTGTRGPLLASMPMVLLFVFDLCKQFVKGRTGLLLPLFGFVAVIAASVYWQLDNFMKRSFERQSDTVIDLSGRYEAWSFFLEGARSSPWFGRGLGSVLVANDGSIFEGFVVPHNEYIRFFYDGGYVGSVLLFLSLFLVFFIVLKRTVGNLKAYFSAFLLGFIIYSFSDNTLSTVQFIVPFCVYLSAVHQQAAEGGGKETVRG